MYELRWDSVGNTQNRWTTDLKVFAVWPCSLGSVSGFLMVRSSGESWSAMRSLLRTGFCAEAAAPVPGVEASGSSEGAFGRLWSLVPLGWDWGWGTSWVELVFEVYSAANCRIIRCMISRATRGMWGSVNLGRSAEGKYMKESIYDLIF